MKPVQWSVMVLALGLLAAHAAEPPATTMELWGASWRVQGSLVWTNDPVLKRPVHEAVPYQRQPVTIEATATSPSSYSVEALVRFHRAWASTNAQAGSAALAFGLAETNVAYTVSLGSGRSPGQVAHSLRLGGGKSDGPWRTASPTPRFSASDISPVMEEDFRLRLENDFSSLPAAREWARLRVEVRPEQMRTYVNGYLAGFETNRITGAGAVRLQLSGAILLDSLNVTPLPPAAGSWVTVPLDSLCNAEGFVDRAALKLSAFGILDAGDVPFLLPEPAFGPDHVDVGVSMYRYNRQWGYEPASKPPSNHPGPEQYDPAQFKFWVPHSVYRRAWVLAASDGAPNSTPILTVRFFKPGVGWDVDAARAIPEWSATTAPADARRIDVQMKDGKPGALWAVPIELDAGALAGDYRDQGGFLTVELTKETHDFVAYPDPCSYGSFQGGLPSAARVYGLTFEKAPVSAYGTGEQRGNLYPHPEKARWFVNLASQSDRPANVQVQVRSEGPLGTVSTQRQDVALAPGQHKRVEFAPATREWGLYRVQTTITSGDWTQLREGTFLMLPPDKERKATAKTSRWGIWNWGGTHGTEADPAVHMRQMRLLGILGGGGKGSNAIPGRSSSAIESLEYWGLAPLHNRIVGRGYPAWAKANPPDPEASRAFTAMVASNAAAAVKECPGLLYFNCFAEDSISLRTTHGLPPYAFGQPWFEYTASESERIRGYYVTAQAAAAGVKQGAPGRKFIMGHCSPDFFLQFFREPDWRPEPFDGFGLDQPQFERMPERPPRATEPSSLYFLYKEMKDRGMKKELVHLESYFPSSHRLALGHRRQADSIVRTAALSLSLGTTKFLDTWSLHDCGGQWGSQHYGCVGLIGRMPEYNPKPAAAAYATMSRVLDLAEYDGFLDIGSRGAYCLRFKDPDGKRLVYAVWTIRGQRPLALTFAAGAAAVAVDENGNETVLKPEACSVTLSPTPIWLVFKAGSLEKAVAGAPVYDEAPGANVVVLDDFEKAGWTYSAAPYPPYASNHWDVVREPAAMTSAWVRSDERTSTVWRVAIAALPEGKPMVGFYGVFTPAKPLAIPGKARALGFMGRGTSAWNRVVFELQDARGEFWRSIGTKDAWNCDDTHSRSYFNFDGWRYVEFPLPGTLPGDNYREKDTVWWGHSDEGIVDLPVRLTRLIVETRTHQIYVNEMLPILDSAVELDNLVAVYDSPELMTDRPIQIQKAAAIALAPKRGGQGLPNPIAELAAAGVGEPPEIARLHPPDQQNDGTKVNVSIKPVPSAQQYKVWVAVYPDGKGAKALATGNVPGGTNALPKGAASLKAEEPTLLIRGLKPDKKFCFFATYLDVAGKESKPSKVRETVLKDEFPMK